MTLMNVEQTENEHSVTEATLSVTEQAPDSVPDNEFNTPHVPNQPPAGPLSWTASEFIAHHKEPSWYAILTLVTLIIATLIYLLLHDLIACSMVIIGGIFFAVIAAREPRQLAYRLDYRGLSIGSKFYDLQQFRSFAVVPEGAFSSIVLMPLKRFAPITTIYYAPGDEEEIIDVLSDELAYVEHHHDPIDKLMRHIRF
jgi:hypothetical protein